MELSTGWHPSTVMSDDIVPGRHFDAGDTVVSNGSTEIRDGITGTVVMRCALGAPCLRNKDIVHHEHAILHVHWDHHERNTEPALVRPQDILHCSGQ